ncbi:MAG: hypothetical protein H7343_01530 [Undibacterium sp.]|nr:hypothetical protein [Opitutaceae bacterium]
MVAELVILWLILAYSLPRLHETSLPWYTTPTALLPWLFLRWPFPRRLPIRTPLLAGLHWLRIHTGGLVLAFATLSIFFGVAPRGLLPFAGWCFALLAG